MNVEHAYNRWAEQYDTNKNKTRDLEAAAFRLLLKGKQYGRVLEIGCGTGKNTEWLISNAADITAVDLSDEMLNKAKEKISSQNVRFVRADILNDWNFADGLFQLVTFSLMLEHIEDIASVIAKAAGVLSPGGYIYIGELHPFKQYAGTKARFETEEGVQVVNCFNHHLSDFIKPALKNGLSVEAIEEFFDDDNPQLPRILAILLRK